MNQADILNYREIRPGSEYDHLIPKGRCESQYRGEGMTDFSIREMVAVVEQYGWQADGLADVLEKTRSHRRRLQYTISASDISSTGQTVRTSS